MCIVIGRQKVQEALWGLKFRLYSGAALSMLDLFTDLQTVYRFFNEGRNSFAYLNIAFICVSLILQLLVSWVQNRKLGMKLIAYESMLVVTMVKVTVDARRVANASGDNGELASSLFNSHMELTMDKCAEIFGESIPSSVLQSYAFLESKNLVY